MHTAQFEMMITIQFKRAARKVLSNNTLIILFHHLRLTYRQVVEHVDTNIAAILHRYGTWSSMTQILDKIQRISIITFKQYILNSVTGEIKNEAITSLVLENA